MHVENTTTINLSAEDVTTAIRQSLAPKYPGVWLDTTRFRFDVRTSPQEDEIILHGYGCTVTIVVEGE